MATLMRTLGTAAPAFELTDVRTGDVIGRTDFAGRPLVVLFLCNHCPYVKRIQPGLVALGNDYAATDVAIVGIASNDADAYPEDSPAELAKVADEQGYVFPLLYDADQSVARVYEAVCTPDIYVFDRDHRLVYRGQFDDARPRNDEPVTGHDLRRAIDAVLAGLPVPEEQTPAVGCGIKWKPGNEPD
ncbi:MAG: thioredoxin family protein [Acidimicrobiia bacterium]